MSEYIYRIQPTKPEMLSEGPTPDEERIVGDHYSYLKSLTDQGVVILAGRTLNTDESSFGIIIFRAESEEAAQRIVANDPAVSGGVMCAELYPYRIAWMADEPSSGDDEIEQIDQADF
jgi:uncharacterized protein YciI